MRWISFSCRWMAVVLLLGCNGSKEGSYSTSGRLYYLDVNAISGTGKVYVYEPVNDTLQPIEYWHRRYSGDLRSSTLYSQLYTPERELLMATEEHIDIKGAALTKMDIALPTPEGERTMVGARISAATTFLFGDPDPSVAARYQIEYREPREDSLRVILTRVRRYVGDEQYVHHTQQAFPGRKYIVQETLETETEGFTESTWQTTEIYVPQWGLVYYRKEINPQMIIEYRLREIIDYDKFFVQSEYAQ